MFQRKIILWGETLARLSRKCYGLTFVNDLPQLISRGTNICA